MKTALLITSIFCVVFSIFTNLKDDYITSIVSMLVALVLAVILLI